MTQNSIETKQAPVNRAIELIEKANELLELSKELLRQFQTSKHESKQSRQIVRDTRTVSCKTRPSRCSSATLAGTTHHSFPSELSRDSVRPRDWCPGSPRSKRR